MTNEQLDSVLRAIMERGNPAYTTPSGAFLEHLRVLAQQQNLTSYAEACDTYTRMAPESANFIAERTPGILCNNYFTVLPEFDYQKFIRWSLAYPEWGTPLRESFSSAAQLGSAAKSICISVEEFA